MRSVFQCLQSHLMNNIIAAAVSIASEYVLVLSLSLFKQTRNSRRSDEVVERENAGRLKV